MVNRVKLTKGRLSKSDIKFELSSQLISTDQNPELSSLRVIVMDLCIKPKSNMAQQGHFMTESLYNQVKY